MTEERADTELAAARAHMEEARKHLSESNAATADQIAADIDTLVAARCRTGRAFINGDVGSEQT